VRQKSATTLNEAWIPRLAHKLLCRDTHIRSTPSSIAYRFRARARLLVHENQKKPMK
jgi:hypothetical protein